MSRLNASCHKYDMLEVPPQIPHRLPFRKREATYILRLEKGAQEKIIRQELLCVNSVIRHWKATTPTQQISKSKE